MRFFRRKPAEVFSDPIAETEELISLEQALLASLQIITFQKEAWEDLKYVLEGRGLSVNPTPNAQNEYRDLYAHLRASMVVLAEVKKYPTKIIENIGNDTL
jgi:hypothetical protein